MKNLVLKDMRLLGVFNIIIAATALALGIISIRPGKNYEAIFIYALGALVPIYLLIVRMAVNDMTSNANPLLISLPIKRFDIVKSRYMSFLVYIFLILGIVFLSSNISRTLIGSKNDAVFNLTSILLTTSLALVFLSVNIPLQYYNARKTQVFNTIFYLFIVLSPNLLSRLNLNLSNSNIILKLVNFNLKLISPVLLAVSFIVYLVSMLISTSIYGRKEF